MNASGTAPVIGIPVTSIPLVQVIPVFFFLVFFVWLIYTIVSAYHWLRYSGNLNLALPMLITHIIISCLLAIYAVSGLAH